MKFMGAGIKGGVQWWGVSALIGHACCFKRWVGEKREGRAAFKDREISTCSRYYSDYIAKGWRCGRPGVNILATSTVGQSSATRRELGIQY